MAGFFEQGRGELSTQMHTGCGTQHPFRALNGTHVLLATAPTMIPCFRHWRQSSLLQVIPLPALLPYGQQGPTPADHLLWKLPAAFPSKMPFFFHAPTREKAAQKRPQAFLSCKSKIIFPLTLPKRTRRQFKIVYSSR